ncbi:MAG: 3-dehydroquinate synthase, partial [Clostridia bacterium]|nr:3-dehydroquinate synthase [Clostridia bacterium]
MTVRVNLQKNSYDVVVQRGILSDAASLLDLSRRVLIVTDDGVPDIYAKTVARSCLCPKIVTI